ncbi:MAG: 30S ribosomal protein S15 [Chloroflexi bacterium]|nr:30S ribosomal protein S15 [Chloroflexota bacterium]
MPLTAERKTAIIIESKTHETDSGSVDVQVSILSARINQIVQHLREHERDHSSRRGLLKLVGARRRLLRYLARIDHGRYQALIGRLGLRR